MALGAVDNSRCLMCHTAPTLGKAAKSQPPVLYVDPDKFASSAHGAMACIDCHVDLANQPLVHKRQAATVQCAGCHVMPGLSPDGVHSGVPVGKQPRCKDCHGTHYVRKKVEPGSPVNRSNVESTCAICHRDGPEIRPYLASVHARVQAGSRLPAAVCTDCHRAHDVAATEIIFACSKCHREEFQLYSASVHASGRSAGYTDAPTCTDCHGTHDIRSRKSTDSATYPVNVPDLCGECHGDPVLQQRYGLPSDTVITFRHSYHGVALEHGDTSVATCTSCHQAHDILAPENPLSTVNRKNLPDTCGKCHFGANENYAKGKVHVLARREDSLALYYTASGFKWLTIGTMAMLIGHIILDLWARVRNRICQRKRGEGA